MTVSLDTIVNFSKASVLHPITLLAFIVYRARLADGWPVRDGYINTAYFFLIILFGSWFSNRWRNGLIPLSRLNAQTWPEEIVLVTGGAQGIAKHVCDMLIEKGAKVAAVDIVPFKATHANMRTYKCDIASYEGLSAIKSKIRSDLGGDVTMVANIAGINNKSLILDLDMKMVDKMIDVNLKSHFWTAMLFLPEMVKRKRGHFLSVSSTMGYAGICHQSDYVAAKHGLVGMNESLYYEMHKMYKTPYVRTSIAMIGHTETSLFGDFNVHSVGKFLGPILKAENVAKLIVDALEAQESRIILTPWVNNLAPGIKAYPSFLRDLLQWSSGGDGSYSSRPSASQLGTED